VCSWRSRKDLVAVEEDMEVAGWAATEDRGGGPGNGRGIISQASPSLHHWMNCNQQAREARVCYTPMGSLFGLTTSSLG
jgi:hypothetical protein